MSVSFSNIYRFYYLNLVIKIREFINCKLLVNSICKLGNIDKTTYTSFNSIIVRAFKELTNKVKF